MEEIQPTLLDKLLWMRNAIIKKTAEIASLENPRKSGGAYRNFWAYPAGKIIIMANIDGASKRVYFKQIITLP